MFAILALSLLRIIRCDLEQYKSPSPRGAAEGLMLKLRR